MAGRIPGNGMRMLSNIVRSMNKVGTRKVADSLFSGYTVSVGTPSSELRSILEGVQSKGFHNGAEKKPLSEYTVTVSADKRAGTRANVGASDTVLTKMGVNKETLNTLQQSIRTAFNNSLEMMQPIIRTIASGADPALHATIQNIMKFMKNTA